MTRPPFEPDDRADGADDAPGSGTETGSRARTFRRQDVGEADPTFTAWLGNTLHETYDPISQEALPDDLEALLRRLENIPSHRRH